MKNAKFLRILKVRGSVLKVRGSVLKFIPRFGRFEVRLPEVREVRGSEFPGSTQHEPAHLGAESLKKPHNIVTLLFC